MSFDRLAPHYDWLEAVLAGSRLHRARRTWRAALAGRKEILFAGVGHGPSLPEFARGLPGARFTCVDASAAMLARAERRVHTAGFDPAQFRFLHAALPQWTPPAARFDAVVTDFFLDCFAPEQLTAAVARLAGAARPETVWLVTDFAIPPAGAARWRAQFVHALMYACFRCATGLPARRLTEPDALLRAAGFTLRGRQTSNWGLLRADCWVRAAAQDSLRPACSAGSAASRSSNAVSVASSFAFSREEKWAAMPSR